MSAVKGTRLGGVVLSFPSAITVGGMSGAEIHATGSRSDNAVTTPCLSQRRAFGVDSMLSPCRADQEGTKPDLV